MTGTPAPNLKYVATLAVVAVIVLVGGALLRPRARSAAQPPPSDTDVRRLAALTERRALESAGAFLGQLAADVAPSLVWLEEPGATGLVWAASTIATARFRPPPASRLAITAFDGSVTATRVDWSPDLPVARVAVPALNGAKPVTRAEPPVQPGMPLLAVWRTANQRSFAAATFIELASVPCEGQLRQELRTTLTFAEAGAGGGVFDLDGNLVAVVLPCGDRYGAFAGEAVANLLTAVESFEHRLLARYGLVLEPLTPDDSVLFAATAGAMVREVRSGGAAAIAGLRPGDIVVGLDGAPVTRLEDLRPLTGAAPEAPVILSIQRASTVREVTVAGPSAGADGGESESGITWQTPPPGLVISAVQPGSRAAAAGLRAGDRVLRVGQREPRSPEQLRRALEDGPGRAAFVEFERGGRLRGVVLPAGGR